MIFTWSAFSYIANIYSLLYFFLFLVYLVVLVYTIILLVSSLFSWPFSNYFLVYLFRFYWSGGLIISLSTFWLRCDNQSHHSKLVTVDDISQMLTSHVFWFSEHNKKHFIFSFTFRAFICIMRDFLKKIVINYYLKNINCIWQNIEKKLLVYRRKTYLVAIRLYCSIVLKYIISIVK